MLLFKSGKGLKDRQIHFNPYKPLRDKFVFLVFLRAPYFRAICRTRNEQKKGVSSPAVFLLFVGDLEKEIHANAIHFWKY